MKKILTILLFLSCITSLAQEPIPYRKDTLWGFCNKKKEILIPCKYTKVNRFYNDSAAIVWINNACGLIGINGHEITDLKYSHIKKYNDFYFVKKKNLWGVIDSKGKIILDIKFEDISFINRMFYTSRTEILTDSIKKKKDFVIINSNVYYVFNKDTTLVYSEVPKHLIEDDFEYLTYDEDSFNNVYVNDKYLYKPEIFKKVFNTFSHSGKYINSDNKPEKYRVGNNIMAYKDDQWGFKDTLGNIIISPRYDKSQGFSNNIAAVKMNGKWGFIDKNDTIIIPFKYSKVKNFSDEISWVKNDTAWALINIKNKLLTPFIYSSVSYFRENLAYVEKNGKWGYIDTDGKEKIGFIYSKSFEFSEGLALSCTSDSTCGYINRKGKVKIPFIYRINYGGVFIDGVAEARDKINNKYYYGFINKRGKIVVPIKYESCYDYNSFYNGLAVLQIPNEAFNIDYKNIFYVDKEGNLFFE